MAPVGFDLPPGRKNPRQSEAAAGGVRDTKEPRVERTRLHALNEIIAICGFVRGVEDWVGLEFFGNPRRRVGRNPGAHSTHVAPANRGGP